MSDLIKAIADRLSYKKVHKIFDEDSILLARAMEALKKTSEH